MVVKFNRDPLNSNLYSSRRSSSVWPAASTSKTRGVTEGSHGKKRGTLAGFPDDVRVSSNEPIEEEGGLLDALWPSHRLSDVGPVSDGKERWSSIIILSCNVSVSLS